MNHVAKLGAQRILWCKNPLCLTQMRVPVCFFLLPLFVGCSLLSEPVWWLRGYKPE